MEKLEFKTITTIVIALTLIMTTFLAVMPSAGAQGIESTAHLMVGHDPVGVGQGTLIVYGLLQPPLGANIDPATPRWEGLTVTITKPDGNVETRSGLRSDSTGSNFFIFQPDQVGTYLFKCSFPGQTIDGIYYTPSVSGEVPLTVQEDPIPGWSSIGPPTEYWTHPIYSMNREWWQLTGTWLALGGGSHGVGTTGPDRNSFNPYTTAPNTAHVVWSKELTIGGLAGGQHEHLGYYGGQPYEARFHPPIVISGRLYYNLFDVRRYTDFPGFTCVDLRTGETLWTNNDGVISKASVPYWGTPNQFGVLPPMLWSTVGSTWHVYDAFTGDWWATFENATSGLRALDDNGNMLVYVLNSRNNWFAMWNSTKAMVPSGINFRPRQGTYDWSRGVEWNVTVPDVAGNPALGTFDTLISPSVVIAEEIFPPTPENQVYTLVQVAYSLKKGDEGRQLWVANRTDIGERANRDNYRNAIVDDTFIVYHREERRYVGYNMYTGVQEWVSDAYDTNDWAGFTRTVLRAYGKLLTVGQDGYFAAFDGDTGELLWKTDPSQSYMEEGYVVDSPYGHHSFTTHSAKVVADGKVFAATGEHSPNQPLWRGGQLYAVDVDSGEVVWRLTGWWDCGQTIVADGYLVGFNGYDNRIYSVGKGPSETTVSIQNDVVTLGSSAMVKGTVMDISAGAKQAGVVERFPKGLPAVADEYMTQWMEYVYMQQPRPTDATGVTVKIESVDPNGNYQNYGATTTDTYGNYGFAFEPEVPGTYMIIATYEGSESYYSSTDTAYLKVEAAAEPSTPIEPEEPTEPEEPVMPLITTEVAIIAAVAIFAIIGIAAYWLLRK
jgi:hypothetical protein